MSATRPATNRKSATSPSPRKPNITPGKGSNSISATSYVSDVQSIHIPSKIPVSQHITVTSPMPQPHCTSTYEADTKLYHSTIFPRHHPNSSNDVALLDHWITQRLREASLHDATPTARLSQQLEVLNMGFAETVRQVAINSNSRAELLHRLWCSSTEVYSNLLNELTATITSMQSKIDEANKSVASMQNELNLQQWKYEKELTTLRSLTTTNKSEESAAYRELQQDLFMKDRDLRSMENTIAELSLWFPNFQHYSSSILRKHLPPVDEAAISALKAATTTTDGESVMIPQDLLVADLLRIQQLNIGISITTLDDDDINPLPANTTSASPDLARRRMSKLTPRFTAPPNSSVPPPPSTATPSPLSLANRKKLKLNRQVSLQDTVSSSSFKALLVENQLQVVVNEELSAKYKSLQQLHTTTTTSLQLQVATLTHQLSLLQDAATTTTTLPHLPDPYPNLSHELVMLYYTRQGTQSPPSQLLAVGDIQKSLQMFTLSLVNSSSSWCWLPGSAGKFSGCSSRGLELRCVSFEAMLTYHLYQQPALQRNVKERIRRLVWSILVWSGSSGNNSYSEELPRSLLEHEKCMLQVFKSLLRLNQSSATSINATPPSTTESAASSTTRIYHDAYAAVFVACIAALSRYLRSNNSCSSVIGGPPASCNLFSSGSPSPLPTTTIARLLRRVICPLDAAMVLKPSEGPIYGGPWWCNWPLKLYNSTLSELDLLSLKHGGTSIDAYDFISTLGTALQKHVDILTVQLQELYRYLNGVTDGHREPMFYTLLLAILEPPNGVPTTQHKMLPAMLMQLSTSEAGLNEVSFATTILHCSNITLGGLAILSEPPYRIRPQLLQEGRQLLHQLRQLLAYNTNVPDATAPLDGLTAHAAICFEQFEEDESGSGNGPPLSDLLYSYRSLCCVLQLNEAVSVSSPATPSAVLVGELHHNTRAALHYQQYLLRWTLTAWTKLILDKNESDDEDGSPLVSHRKRLESEEVIVARSRRGANEPSQLIPERSLSKAYSRTESSG